MLSSCWFALISCIKSIQLIRRFTRIDCCSVYLSTHGQQSSDNGLEIFVLLNSWQLAALSGPFWRSHIQLITRARTACIVCLHFSFFLCNIKTTNMHVYDNQSCLMSFLGLILWSACPFLPLFLLLSQCTQSNPQLSPMQMQCQIPLLGNFMRNSQHQGLTANDPLRIRLGLAFHRATFMQLIITDR